MHVLFSNFQVLGMSPGPSILKKIVCISTVLSFAISEIPYSILMS
jgi:hypothetical protein